MYSPGCTLNEKHQNSIVLLLTNAFAKTLAVPTLPQMSLLRRSFLRKTLLWIYGWHSDMSRKVHTEIRTGINQWAFITEKIAVWLRGLNSCKENMLSWVVWVNPFNAPPNQPQSPTHQTSQIAFAFNLYRTCFWVKKQAFANSIFDNF